MWLLLRMRLSEFSQSSKTQNCLSPAVSCPTFCTSPLSILSDREPPANSGPAGQRPPDSVVSRLVSRCFNGSVALQ